ncbi:MAG TPA: hypothetical protein PKD12_08180 [Nitrospira sp.]|nr:hypothetical protein [Nitrospira sp.]
MRLTLEGTTPVLDPIVLNLPTGNFAKAEFVALGYTDFDVICIGAAGGVGGGIYSPGASPQNAIQGGSPGGGGIHRVQGLLSALGALTPVVIGAAGVDQPNNATNSVSGLANGTDGGATTFDGTRCRASGGKGGKSPTSYSPAGGNSGGDGGIGNSTTAGGGALGSTAVGTPGADGTWDGTIGKGGGGGKGGNGIINTGVLTNAATPGGKGAYNSLNLAVMGLAGAVGPMLVNAFPNILGGFGGGAKATPINGSDAVYGTRVPGGFAFGACFIKLTVGPA